MAVQACTSSCRPEASPEASVPCFLSPAQVICKDWSNLAGKSYIILNMTENIDCVSAELAMRRGKGRGRCHSRALVGRPAQSRTEPAPTTYGKPKRGLSYLKILVFFLLDSCSFEFCFFFLAQVTSDILCSQG